MEDSPGDRPWPRGDFRPDLLGGDRVPGLTSEWDGIIKARKLFFEAEQALAKASQDYEKARIGYERACTLVGVTLHYAP